MAKAHTVSTGEWAKHLRPEGKREFWKKERAAGKKVAAAEPVRMSTGMYGGRAPDRVCGNCGQWVWSGRCLNECQAKGFDR
jgi:hypothetical protein